MRRFLFITYAFPPLGGAGVQRPAKFAKYVGRHGWRPVVVTAGNPSGPTTDASLVADLPPDLIVERIRSIEPGHGLAQGGRGGEKSPLRSLLGGLAANLLFPDRHVLWLATAMGPTLAAAKRHGVEAVFVSGPPFSSFLLAERVARKLNLPLLLDFRDEWSGYYSKGFAPGAHGLWDRLVASQERRLVGRAATVTAASPAYCRRFAELYGGPDQKYLWIPNGYDPDDFAGYQPGPTPRQPGDLRIVYTGTVFGVTSLEPLWRGLRLMTPGMRRHISVEICGRVAGDEVTQPRIPGLMVDVRGYLPHAQVLQHMAQADVLLLTLADLPGSERVIPGKVFEYAATRKPILAICPPGEAADIVRALGGMVVPPSNPPALAEALTTWLSKPPGLRGEPPPQFDRDRQARLLADALSRAVGD